MERGAERLLADIGVGFLAGLVATAVTDLAQRPLRWATPDAVLRHEQRVSPGPASSAVAARKLAEGLGHRLDAGQIALSGKVVHYGLGMIWGPVYGLLRRHGGLRPLGAGVAAGTALALVMDEGVTPALGLSAPNGNYLLATHLRGFLAHLVWGGAAALTAEAIYRLTSTAPGPARSGGSARAA